MSRQPLRSKRIVYITAAAASVADERKKECLSLQSKRKQKDTNSLFRALFLHTFGFLPRSPAECFLWLPSASFARSARKRRTFLTICQKGGFLRKWSGTLMRADVMFSLNCIILANATCERETERASAWVPDSSFASTPFSASDSRHGALVTSQPQLPPSISLDTSIRVGVSSLVCRLLLSRREEGGHSKL